MKYCGTDVKEKPKDRGGIVKEMKKEALKKWKKIVICQQKLEVNIEVNTRKEMKRASRREEKNQYKEDSKNKSGKKRSQEKK